eukprot:TRINITY_DN24236_c0_g1_i1.p3 TRINITY_DN24236_c0_g1~~TRINITY_DN24236_c0_g1_i1.p3  ORF type:complete len:105 (-),score=21.47 TRINITY_DN24236_c0_g1_i1:317-631(-)
MCFFFLMIRRPPRSTQGVSSAASDVYKRQYQRRVHGDVGTHCRYFTKKGFLRIYVGFVPRDFSSQRRNLQIYVDPQITHSAKHSYNVDWKHKLRKVFINENITI